MLHWIFSILTAHVAASRIAQSTSYGEGISAIGVPSATKPIRLHGGILYGPGVGMYVEGLQIMVSDPVTATIETNAARWSALQDVLLQDDVNDPSIEAAAKLISSKFPIIAHVCCQLTKRMFYPDPPTFPFPHSLQTTSGSCKTSQIQCLRPSPTSPALQ